MQSSHADSEDGKLRTDGLDLRAHLRGDGGGIDLSAQKEGQIFGGALVDVEIDLRNAEQGPALVRSLGSQVVHPVWCGLEIPTLDLVYKASNCGVDVYRHSGRVS